MNRCLIRCRWFLLGGAFCFLFPRPGTANQESAGEAASLAEVVPILQAHFVDYDNLGLLSTDRLEDLVARAQGEILVQASTTAPAAVPLICVALPAGPLYCRFAAFTPRSGWGDLALKLREGVGQAGNRGVILDLRNTSTPNDFAGAARMAGFFLPAGLPLFTLRNSRHEAQDYVTADLEGSPPSSHGPVVVLINGGTAGAGEALAAALKAHGAVTVGRSTSGNGAQFEEHPLASGRTLRYVSGQVTMADGTPLWRHSVPPDIGLLVDARKETAALDSIAQGRLLDVIHELPGSHRLSEAALVAGEDPGVEAYLVTKDKGGPPPAPQDSTLVAALDSLKAILVTQGEPVPAGVSATKTAPVPQ